MKLDVSNVSLSFLGMRMMQALLNISSEVPFFNASKNTLSRMEAEILIYFFYYFTRKPSTPGNPSVHRENRSSNLLICYKS